MTHRLGMRGGLGKTLLITFLLLTIVPLSLLAFLTYNQIQGDTGLKLMASLENVVALKEAHLVDWLGGYERELSWLAGVLDSAEAAGRRPSAGYTGPLTELQAIDPTFDALVLMDPASGQVLASTDPAWADPRLFQSLLEEADGQRPAASYGLIVTPPLTESGERLSDGRDGWVKPIVAVKYAWGNADASGRPLPGNRLLIGVLRWDSLQQLLSSGRRLSASVVLYLVTQDGRILTSEGLTTSEELLARDHPARSAVQGGVSSLDDGTGLTRVPAGLTRVPAGLSPRGLGPPAQSGTYTGLEGNSVFGAYRWNPELQLGFVAEQSQRQALSSGNTATAVVVGTTLAVALVTTILAAVVTRRVTRPIVQLTETAARMARGDLNHRVLIERGDEIGVLSRAFNRMAAELGVLYENLEARVTERTRQLAERTQQLEAANEEIRGYLMQLATSAEVARVAVSIRDSDELLTTVVGLISQAFELDDASVYLLDEARGYPGEARGYPSVPGGRRGIPALPLYPPVRWKVWRSEGYSGNGVPTGLTGVPTGSVPHLVDLVAADGCRHVVQAGIPREEPWPLASVECTGASDVSTEAQACGPTGAGGALTGEVCELAVALRIQQRVLGVLDLRSSRPDAFGEDEQVLYQSLADQIGIAIENARVYAVERQTVARLRELDRIQSEFLTNMSHALRTPLNSIIGFSRVLLKELDGPLNETQRTDLIDIYDSGRQLLGLINDMLELSQLQLGMAPFAPSEVDLAEIIEGVMATTRALARGKPVRLYEEVPKDLPAVYTDGQWVRQVVLALLSSAVKFTARGSIHLRVSTEDGHVTISVQDTGMGFSREERERIFSNGEEGSGEAGGAGGYAGGAGASTDSGFGLAISRQVVEKLGGQIWMESEEGIGSTFTFTLPMRPKLADTLTASGGDRDAV